MNSVMRHSLTLLRVAASVLAVGAFSSLQACASDAGSSDEDDGTGGSQDEIVSGQPDERRIAGKLTREVGLMESATASSNDAPTCTLAEGDVLVAKFEKGHYDIRLEGERRCGNVDRGWVPADAVTIEPDAYFGKLVP